MVCANSGCAMRPFHGPAADHHRNVGFGRVRPAVRALSLDAQIDAGVQLRELGEPRQQHLAREIRRYVQPHAGAAEARAQLLGHGFQPHEQIVYLLEIARTGIGERQRPCTTRKQRQAQLRFQRLDLVAHRRRRDAKLIGCDGEARMFGGDLKGLDGLQRRGTHSIGSPIDSATSCDAGSKARRVPLMEMA